MVKATLLREHLVFERRGDVIDGYGNVKGDWLEQFSLWARVTPLKGGEAVIAERMQGSQPVVIRVRHSVQSARVDSSWRARDTRTGRTYNITSAANMDERREFIDILAVSGGADG